MLKMINEMPMITGMRSRSLFKKIREAILNGARLYDLLKVEESLRKLGCAENARDERNTSKGEEMLCTT